MRLDAIPVILQNKEICLAVNLDISCLTKSEWLIVFQIFSTVLAIYFSSIIATRQFIKSEIVKEEASGRKLIHSFSAMRVFFENVNILRKINENDFINIESIQNYRLALSEYQHLLRGVNIEDLSVEWANACIHSRTSITQMIGIFESLERKFNTYLEDRAAIINNNPIEARDEKLNNIKEHMFKVFVSTIEALQTHENAFIAGEQFILNNIDKSSRYSKGNNLRKFFKI